jgi:hypothetical protein
VKLQLGLVESQLEGSSRIISRFIAARENEFIQRAFISEGDSLTLNLF